MATGAIVMLGLCLVIIGVTTAVLLYSVRRQKKDEDAQ